MSNPAAKSEPDQTSIPGFDLDGTSFVVREHLVDILGRELLGPTYGPEEVLPFSPRSQYLIGHIAPVKLTGVSIEAEDDQASLERGDLVEARSDDGASTEQRGVPAYVANETEADAEGDDSDDRTPK